MARKFATRGKQSSFIVHRSDGVNAVCAVHHDTIVRHTEQVRSHAHQQRSTITKPMDVANAAVSNPVRCECLRAPGLRTMRDRRPTLIEKSITPRSRC